MVLKEHELLQIDEQFIHKLLESDPRALAGLSIKLTNDLKEALERLNQNPSNRSKPSGSLAPWDKGAEDDDELTPDEQATLGSDIDKAQPSDASTDLTSEDTNNEHCFQSEGSQEHRQPGRQPGSQGFGRTQTLEVTETKHHRCGCCTVCNAALAPIEKAYTGFQTVNIEFGNADKPGVQLSNTHHVYYTGHCPNCGLENRTAPWRAPADTLDWNGVGMTQWRLIGPDLAALIVYLSMDMRVTRRKVKQCLFDVFGLEISVGTLQNCIIESARALAPVEEQLIEDLCRESLLHADETSHNEAGTRLWLWVFINTSTALFLIGHRTKEMFVNLFDAFASPYDGYLMSDGYQLYRAYHQRLRCWAHLIRKAKGLCDSYTEESRLYGQQVHDTLNCLIDAIYQAREGPDEGTVSISADHQQKLENLRNVCEEMSASSHQKTRELGREFLNDWTAIFRVLDYPAWPLTNNEAERALRHWVILRKMTQGTRSEQGSRALALFASVIATCRLRNSSPLLYLRDVVKMRRQGDDVPQLPQIPALVVA